jgi:P2-related tail formation protein
MNSAAMEAKMHATTVRSVQDLVSAFGGTKAMADWADVGMSAVSNWISANSIPSGYHLRLYLEIQRRCIAVDASVFGLRGAAADALMAVQLNAEASAA